MVLQKNDSQAEVVTRRWIAVIETVVWTLVIAGLLILLSSGGKKYETSWIIISVLPVLLWLVFTGRITSLKAFGVEFKSAIRRASGQRIKPDLIDYEQISSEPKGRREQIPVYEHRTVTGLTFMLGRKGFYAPDVMREYFDALGRHAFFKWVVFTRQDHHFAGIISAHALQQYAQHLWLNFRNGREESGYNLIREMIEAENVDDLPGLIGPGLALSASDTTKRAIKNFSKTDVDYLPVLDEQDRFIGVLNRGKLMSEMIGSILEAAQS